MTDIWDANIYSQFINLRTRPARDLLSVVPESFTPKTCYDLGCGPGNSTYLLKKRFTDARVIGIDRSTDMLCKARDTYPQITFVQHDIATFESLEKIDFIFANASLHWLSNHNILLPKLASMLSSNGILAIQMPNNFHSPAHQIALEIIQSNNAWKHLSKNLCYTKLTGPLYDPIAYYNVLAKCDLKNILCWETTYFQEMDNHEGIFEWIKGAGLRPVLSKMAEQEQTKFAEYYISELSKTYSIQGNNKILFPFHRLFLVGMYC